MRFFSTSKTSIGCFRADSHTGGEGRSREAKKSRRPELRPQNPLNNGKKRTEPEGKKEERFGGREGGVEAATAFSRIIKRGGRSKKFTKNRGLHSMDTDTVQPRGGGSRWGLEAGSQLKKLISGVPPNRPKATKSGTGR